MLLSMVNVGLPADRGSSRAACDSPPGNDALPVWIQRRDQRQCFRPMAEGLLADSDTVAASALQQACQSSNGAGGHQFHLERLDQTRMCGNRLSSQITDGMQLRMLQGETP